MAPLPWAVSAVLAASAPRASFGIRADAAADLLASSLQMEGIDEASSFAQQRGESHRRRYDKPQWPVYWFDKDGSHCVPYDWQHLDYHPPYNAKFLYDGGNGGQAGITCQVAFICGDFDDGILGLVDEDQKSCDPFHPNFGGHASATDDPHLVSLAGERFEVKQAGWHSLLRVPLGDDGAVAAEHPQPLLALDADLKAPEGAPCGMYMKMVVLSGRWLDGKIVRIRPSSGGGAEASEPLSLQVASGADPETAGRRPWAPFGGSEVNESLAEASTQMVRALAVRRQELGPFSEGQAFKFELLGSGSAGPQASVTVSQGSHQALNVALEDMARLGHARLGGLLGTEPHDHGLEVPTEKCMESRAQSASRLLGLVEKASDDFHPPRETSDGRVGSWMQAAW